MLGNDEVNEKKAKHWTSTPEELVATKTLEQWMASTCAGEMSFALTVAGDKYGRVIASLEMAAKWFIQCLPVLPTLTHLERTVMRFGTDAGVKSVMVGSRGGMQRTVLACWTS